MGLPAFKLIAESSEFASVTAAAGFLALFRIEFMAIGGATALLLYHHAESVKRFTGSPIVYSAIVMFIGVLTTHGDEFSLLLGLLYAALLLFTIDDTNPLVLRSRPLSELGKISYGLYMYHPLVMYGCFAFIHSHLGSHSRGLLYNGLVYGTVVLLSIGVSLLSHRFVEQPFLRLKNRQFTVIESGAA
ncbi:MAG: acyltransferase [Planctomycetaceae bacterium]|nr:acyltransferase [Planctomycetaceae bacterium]